MPLPAAAIPLIAGTIAAGSSAASGAANRRSTRKQNEQDRWFQMAMYNRQRQDALDDWHMQNAYNSPEQQMQRWKEAGLNPHLIYQRTQESPTIRSSSVPTNAQPAPQYENSIGAGLDAGFRIQQQQVQNAQIQAQTDNIRAQNDLILKEGMYKDASTAKILQDTATSVFELDKAKELKDFIIDRAKLENQKLAADTDFTIANTKVVIDRNDRERLLNSANIAKTMQDIVSSKIQNAKTGEEIKNLRLLQKITESEGVIKGIEEDLRFIGISPNDPYYIRMLFTRASKIANDYNKGNLDSRNIPWGRSKSPRIPHGFLRNHPNGAWFNRPTGFELN